MKRSKKKFLSDKLIFKKIFFVGIILFFLGIPKNYAQEKNTYVIISEFEFEGLKKTREGTVLRELDFQKGDSIIMTELTNRISKNKILLLNTGLFYEVNLNITKWENNKITILIQVREQWYIFPIPIFELADRNFNVWWKQYNHSFKRINFGARLYYANITGRKDLLKATLQFGYTQKFELDYKLPFINKAQTLGASTNFLFTRNKEVGYNTIENDLLFFRDDDQFLFKRFRYGLGGTYQPFLYQKHKVELYYFHRIIADTILQMNSNFFLGNKNKQQFFSINYTFQQDKRDIKAYPLQGYFIEGQIQKDGFGIFNDRNALELNSTLALYFPLGKKKKYNLSFITKGRTHLIRKQPSYYNNKALGYFNDFVRGYEYYVVDGLDYFYLKTSLKYEILKKRINWKKAMPLKAFKIMPLQIYLTTNTDIGFVNNPYYKNQNPFSNTLLLGGGVGIDFVIYVDKVIRIEYSMNRLKEKGVYLHYSLFF